MYAMLALMRIGAAAFALMMLTREPVPAEEPQRTILFGCPIALTGALAKEGHLEQEGYDIWADYVNAHGGLRVGDINYQVAIRYIDDASTPSTTARAAERLITIDHVNFLLGPYGSGPTFAAAAIAERHAIPMISSSGSAERTFDQGYRYVFGVQTPARKYLVGIIEYAVGRTPRPHTVAISAANDEFAREVQQGAVQSANDHGIHVVYSQQYATDAASVDATAAAIAAKHPDIVLNAGHLQDAIAMHRALLKHGAAARIYGYTIGPETPDFRAALGDGAQGVLVSAQWSPVVPYVGARGFYRTSAEYAAALTRRTGRIPSYQAAEATAAGVAFADAISAAGTLEPNAVRTALSQLNVSTFFGPIRFDERGVNMYKPMVVNKISGPELVTIYPYRLASVSPADPVVANANDVIARRSADIVTRDFRIETDQTESDLNDGSFTMPHRIRFLRPGVVVVGDSAKGNTRNGIVTITGHAVLHQRNAGSDRLAGATAISSPATLRCDELQVDSKRGIYVATGNVVYIQGSRRATAQNGRFDEDAHALVFYGNVHLADGEQVLTAQTIHYDTLTKKVISNANL